MATANNNTATPRKPLPRWGCPRCGLRPQRQFRFCRRCRARMAFSTNDTLKKIEASYLNPCPLPPLRSLSPS